MKCAMRGIRNSISARGIERGPGSRHHGDQHLVLAELAGHADGGHFVARRVNCRTASRPRRTRCSRRAGGSRPSAGRRRSSCLVVVRNASPVWNQPLRQAAPWPRACCSSRCSCPRPVGAHDQLADCAGATSQSFSSTSRASTPARGLPQVPSGVGLSPETSGQDTSVMLKRVVARRRSAAREAGASSSSGTISALRSGVRGRRGGGPLGQQRRPCRRAASRSVTPLPSLTASQKASVWKASTTAIERRAPASSRPRRCRRRGTCGRCTRMRSSSPM